MSSLTQSVSSVLSEIFPHITAQAETPATAGDIQEINLRISMMNHLLIAVLDNVNHDSMFWQKVDRALFAKTMDENKALISELRAVIHTESRTLALLDSVQSNISKLEKSLSNYPPFNFDLERMKTHVECGSVRMPAHLNNADEVMQWLLQQA